MEKRHSRHKSSSINKAQIFIILIVLSVCVLFFVACKRYIEYDDTFEFNLEEGCSDFYYRQLSGNQRKMYRMIYKEAQEVLNEGKNKSSLGVYKYSDYEINKQDALTVWDAFYFDMPTFFFMSNFYNIDDNSIEILISSEFSKESKRNKIVSSIKKSVSEVKDLLQGVEGEVFRFKVIYDYVMAQTKYKEGKNYELFDGYSCSIASVFDFDDSTDTICQGYAKAISYLCNVFGIECIYVSSDNRDHALNIVKIDGNWYYADSTFDDQEKYDYDFFLKGNDKIWKETIYPNEDESENFLRSKLPELADMECTFELNSLQYAFCSSTSYSVIGVSNKAKHVVIPTEIGDMKVAEIKSGAFEDRKNLLSLKIPNGLKVEEAAVGYYCNNLSIYCEDSSKPDNWDKKWSISDRPILWNCRENGITQDGIKWGLTNDGIMTVTGYFGTVKDIIIPNTINGKDVISICQNAFNKNIVLSSVTIPDCVKFIGEDAFASWNEFMIYCEADSQPSGWDIDWNSKDKPVIWGCRSVGETADGIKWVLDTNGEIAVSGYTGSNIDLVIPDKINGYNVTAIVASAFENIGRLSTVFIPSCVTSVGDHAFWGCDNLTVYCAGGKDTLSDFGYDKCKDRPIVWNCKEYGTTQDGVKWALTTNGIMTISGYCGTKDDIKLPETIDGHSVTAVCENAFYECDILKALTIPSCITSFGRHAFYECKNLTIYSEIESKPSLWGFYNVSNCPVVWNCQEYGTESGIRWGLTKDGIMTIAGYEGDSAYIYIPSIINRHYVTSICEYAFWRKDNIKSVIIGDKITHIGEYAFFLCYGMTEIELPKSLISLGSHAFSGCLNLTSIVIPINATDVGNYAFYECEKLTIYCEAQSAPDGWNAEWNVSNLPVIWGYNG